jgi:hypothetical protein
VGGIVRTVHPKTSFTWKKLKQLAPDIQATSEDGSAPEPFGLAFVDPDLETHIYVFTEDDKKRLISALTGGLVVPSGRR